jgi:hypothetical protein
MSRAQVLDVLRRDIADIQARPMPDAECLRITRGMFVTRTCSTKRQRNRSLH